MSAAGDFSSVFNGFSGKVRLFPLPNLVLFPHVVQPLHVFEPRYRALVEDALRKDRLVAMATLAPGWEEDYEGCPAISPVACLGRIANWRRLDDGTFDVLLRGLRRIRLREELETACGFRQALVELCEDRRPRKWALVEAALHRRLREGLLEVLSLLPQPLGPLDELLASSIPLSVLTDVVGYLLDIEVAAKIELLAETDVHHRAEMLLAHLAAMTRHDAVDSGLPLFPPEFSVN